MDNLSALFVEAGTLMLAGMIFVFVFLGLLVVFINTVLAGLAKSFPDPIIQPSKPRISKTKTTNTGGMSPSIVAAISSAVSQYRLQHNQKK